jgi:hypothetical protein
MLENFIGNFINGRIQEYFGGNLGDHFLSAMYKKKLESRIIESVAYVLINEISTKSAIQEVAYDLIIINYIWAVPNGRAEYKRAISSPIGLVRSVFDRKYFSNKWLQTAEAKFDKFGGYIAIGIETFLAICVDKDRLSRLEADKIFTKLKRNTLEEYLDLVLESHPLGNLTIGYCIESRTNNVSSYFCQKYRGLDILGNVTPNIVAQAISWYG